MYPHVIQFEMRRLELARELRLLDERAAARAHAAGGCAEPRRAAPKRSGFGLARLIRRPLPAS